MIGQICSLKPQDIVTIRSSDLFERLGIEERDHFSKKRRLRWNGHVERSNDAVKAASNIQVGGKRVRSAMRAASQLPGRGH